MDSLKFLVGIDSLDSEHVVLHIPDSQPGSCTLKLNRNDWERLGRPADILLVTSPVLQGPNGPLT